MNLFEDNEEMANSAVLAQHQQLVGQLNALQQTVGNLQASSNTLRLWHCLDFLVNIGAGHAASAQEVFLSYAV